MRFGGQGSIATTVVTAEFLRSFVIPANFDQMDTATAWEDVRFYHLKGLEVDFPNRPTMPFLFISQDVATTRNPIRLFRNSALLLLRPKAEA